MVAVQKIIAAKVGLPIASYFGYRSTDQSLSYLVRFRLRPVYRIGRSCGHKVPDTHSPDRSDADIVVRSQLTHEGPPRKLTLVANSFGTGLFLR